MLAKINEDKKGMYVVKTITTTITTLRATAF
jgi:hypothetical protein